MKKVSYLSLLTTAQVIEARRRLALDVEASKGFVCGWDSWMLSIALEGHAKKVWLGL